MAKKATPENPDADFIKSIRDVAFVIAIYLYFSGWIYLYTYFNFFGVSVRQTDMEFYYFLVYSVNVMSYLIVSHWFITLCVVAASMAIMHWVRYRWVIYVLCIIWFGLLYYSSIVSANIDARNDFAYRGSSLLRIKFMIKPEKETDSISTKKTSTEPSKPVAARPDSAENMTAAFKNYNEQDKLRLLLSTGEGYLVLVTNKSATFDNALAKDKVVFLVKKDDISLAKTTK